MTEGPIPGMYIRDASVQTQPERVPVYPTEGLKSGMQMQKEDPRTSKPVPLLAALDTAPDVRKNFPMCTGMLDYFAAALAEVAAVSKTGNDQHNPGQPLHWEWGKSSDHADCIMRHLADRGLIDVDGRRHTAKLVWRGLALLTEELVAAGAAPMPRAAWVKP